MLALIELGLVRFGVSCMIAVAFRCEVGNLIDEDVPERCVPTVGLHTIDMRLDFGDGQDTTTLFGVKFGINELSNVPNRTAAILAAGQGIHTLHGVRSVGDDRDVVAAIPDHQDH